MRRRANLGALAGALILLGALVAFLGRPSPGSASLHNPGGGTNFPGAAVKFDQSSAGALVLLTKAYRLTLSKKNGAIVSLVDVPTRQALVTGTNGCQWGATAAGGGPYSGGCAFSPGSSSRFSYSWDSSAATLTPSSTSTPS